MKRVLPVLGYTAAALTIVAAILVPFLFINLFTHAFASTGVRIDPAYSGGDTNYVIDRGAYKITVNHPVGPSTRWQRVEPYVQIAWSPEKALPPRVDEQIDIDHDGRPDVRIEFQTGGELRVDAIPETPLVRELRGVGKQSFSRAIVREDGRIVVRVPLTRDLR
jgi:hypothetical protein